MLKSEVIAAINQEITANGEGAIDGPIMNTILMDIVGIIPDPYYRFPATSRLSASTDIGKLIMNNQGFAEVAVETGNTPGQLGVWQVSPVSGGIQMSDSSGYQYIQNNLMSLKICYVGKSGTLEEIYSYLAFSDVFNEKAPSGNLGTDGYRYPNNKSDFADNIVWALQNLQVSASNENRPFKEYFNIDRNGDTLTLTQTFLTTSAEIMFHSDQNAPVNYNILTAPEPASEGFVQNPVLGVLTGIDNNHMALVDNREVVKVILAQDVQFQGNDLQGDFYGNIFYRLLKPVDDGKLAPIFPDTQVNSIVDELATWGTADKQQIPSKTLYQGGYDGYSYDGYSGYGGYYGGGENNQQMPTDALLRVNSTILYEALQEGKAGESIYARRFSFLVPRGASFQVREDYNGNYNGYDKGYYGGYNESYNY